MAVAFAPEQPVGPRAIRSVRLRVIGGSVTIDDHVPATRGECKDGPRPCPHVRCEWHLWRVDGVDGPGRRVAGRAPATTLRPVWLDWPLPPSCGADIADAVGAGKDLSIDELARAYDVRKTALHQELADGLRKLRALGVDIRKILGEE